MFKCRLLKAANAFNRGCDVNRVRTHSLNLTGDTELFEVTFGGYVRKLAKGARRISQLFDDHRPTPST